MVARKPNNAVPDSGLLNELLEAIEKFPPAIEARKLLIQQYATVGWYDAATDALKELLLLDFDDAETKSWAVDFKQSLGDPEPKVDVAVVKRPIPTVIKCDSQSFETVRDELCRKFKALQVQANTLQRDAQLLRDLQLNSGSKVDCGRHLPILQALANGKLSSVLELRPQKSARAVAQIMEQDPGQALDLAIEDLSKTARGSLERDSSVFTNQDSIRQALVKRVTALEAALPEGLQLIPNAALMHVEHEVLKKTYPVMETMLGEPVSEIPRSNFLVTEDGYPWDMEELVQALSASGGIMRNPLSKEMFSQRDVRAIVGHRHGRPLAALQLAQDKMTRGVRPKTISELQILSSAMLTDESDDQKNSRQAVDRFLAYAATLPQAEQAAIDELRVPAVDKHTGQAFDSSIGDSVRDAQANRTCFHKTGDLLQQAAKYLLSHKAKSHQK